jgi:hypothetical protein
VTPFVLLSAAARAGCVHARYHTAINVGLEMELTKLIATIYEQSLISSSSPNGVQPKWFLNAFVKLDARRTPVSFSYFQPTGD